jgi:uncharacterized membrane protein
VLAGLGLLYAVLSLPLIFKLVPRNHYYGIRIRKAFVSDRNWNSINSLGGILIFGCGLLLVVFAHFTRDLAPSPRSILAPVYLIVPLVVEAVVVAPVIYVYAGRLPD